MSRLIIDRVKVIAWLLAFFAPVVMLEVGRELSARWTQTQIYSAPTPEFAKAIAACGPVASADN